MRGKTGALLGLFACVFVGMGVLFGAWMPHETRYSWPGVFHAAFILVGLGIGGMVLYGAIRNVSFYTVVDQSSIEWGRSDRSQPIGRLAIANLAKLVYTEGIDAGLYMILIEKSGVGHKLGGEYLFSDGEAKRLMVFLRQNYPDIEVIQK
jgi:hypothetical protein